MIFPEPVSIDSVVIHWAKDNGEYWSSNKYRIESWKDKKWILLDDMKGPNEKVKSNGHTCGPVKTDRIRIIQNPGDGPKTREDLIWISEIEVFSGEK